MPSIFKISSFIAASMTIIVLFPSLHPFPPAEAIRSSRAHHSIYPLLYRKSTEFKNAAHSTVLNNSIEISIDDTVKYRYLYRKFKIPILKTQVQCTSHTTSLVCHHSLIHIAMTLDAAYLRGAIAAIHSILHHSPCPQNIFLHFIIESDTDTDLYEPLIRSIFPSLSFKTYYFDPEIVRNRICSTVRQPLEQPLNYARNYLVDLLEPCVHKVIYLDSDLVVVDDISKLWVTSLDRSRTIGAPEYCHTNFTKYFTASFWSENGFSGTFDGRKPCYFNTGVMVIDLVKWRRNEYTKKIERWMEVQKNHRIYELGSLPPFLLVFAGQVAPVEHRWNQHGLGGNNVNGSCRDLHPGPVSLLHWSGGGKPWLRLDSKQPCPLDAVWAWYDLYRRSL